MNTCTVDDCDRMGHEFGGLCARHYSYRIQDDPTFDPRSETPEAAAIRIGAWMEYKRKRGETKTRTKIELVGMAMIEEPALIGRAIWHSCRLADPYQDAERKPLYARIRTQTRMLGRLLYSLDESETVELAAPPHRVFDEVYVNYDLFRQLTTIYGEEDWFLAIRPSAARLVQKAANYLLKAGVGLRNQLIAIGSAAYKLATLTKAFETLQTEIGMRAVRALLMRRAAASILPSAALQTFGSDHENVHTPVATGPTEQALTVIATWPSGSGDIWKRLLVALPLDSEPVWNELEWDMRHCASFGHLYGSILERVITRIDTYDLPTQTELFQRLTEEVVEGFGLCVQGKMTRLANVLRGFEPEIDACVCAVPTREQFQNRFAMISKSGLTLVEQRNLANQLMDECLGPEEEREAWLDALESAEE
jgi:hypothetical protein